MKISNEKDFPVSTVFIGERDSPATSVGMDKAQPFFGRVYCNQTNTVGLLTSTFQASF